MKTFVVASLTAALVSIATLGAAQANNSLSARVMADHPGISAIGITVNPTARPDNNGGIQSKAIQDHPGTVGGFTAQPLAKADVGSLQGAIRLN